MRWAHLVSQLTSPKKNVASQAPGSARRLFSQENLFFSNKKNWTFQKNNCTPLWWGYQFSSLTPLQFQSMLSWLSQKFYIFLHWTPWKSTSNSGIPPEIPITFTLSPPWNSTFDIFNKRVKKNFRLPNFLSLLLGHT